jgi:hypothetical protein
MLCGLWSLLRTEVRQERKRRKLGQVERGHLRTVCVVLRLTTLERRQIVE